MMDIYLKYLSVQNVTYYSTGWPTKENILDKVLLFTECEIQNPLPACRVCHRINAVPLFTHL